MEAGSAKQDRSRRGPVYTLIVVASLLTFLAAFAIWANRQLLETDTWVETSTELLEDTEIREALANFMVDELYANVDIQAELESGLPPQLAPLAGPAAAGLRQLTDTAANEALQRPRVQGLWEELNRNAHEKLIEVVEEDSAEPVTLDLGQIVTQLGEQNGIDVAGKVPPDAGQIEVLPADKLSAAQDVVKLLTGVAIVLTLLALFLFGLALYLARGWRREALRGVGFGFLLAGIAAMVARGLAGNMVVESLASSKSVEPAVENTWEIGTSLLAAGGGALLFYGIVILVGSWLAGPGAVARDVRRAITPVLERRPIAYAALGLILALLFWWSPTPGLERLPTSLLIIALLVVGLEAFRAQAVRDFPDETWEGATERWVARLRT